MRKIKPSGITPAAGANSLLPHQRPFRWVMLSLLWLLYFAFGLTQRSIAPLVTPILADLHLSYTQMGFILGSWQLTYIVAAVAAGTLIDRWGIRRTLLAGALTMGLSSSLRYLVTGFGGMLGAVALSGVGGPMISVGCPKAISIWFSGKSRGTAVGIYLTGAWIGGIFALTLTNSVVMPMLGHSWRQTFLLYGMMTFMVGLIWWVTARESGPSAAAGAPGMMSLFQRFIKVRDIRIVLILGLLSFAILHALTYWLPRILETSGFSPALAGAAAAIPLASGIPALLIIPPLVPPSWRGRFLALCTFLTLVTVILIILTSGSMQIVSLILFGIVISTFYPILTLILMDAPEVGTAHMGSAGGMFFCVSEIGGFAGPLITGTIVDMTGTFKAVIFFFAAVCIAAFVLAMSLRKGGPHEA